MPTASQVRPGQRRVAARPVVQPDGHRPVADPAGALGGSFADVGAESGHRRTLGGSGSDKRDVSKGRGGQPPAGPNGKVECAAAEVNLSGFGTKVEL